jgi:radical SAM superfamily enzyme YgiQ (UPF0313 family)
MSSILFIYPPISFRGRSALSAYSPPLGILYLGTILKNRGHEVHVIDAEAEQLSLKQVIKKVKSVDPEVIGLTCLTFTLETCKAIIREVRKVSDAYIAVGGPHVSVAPEASLRELGADVCVIGEAESVIEKIIEDKPRSIVYAQEVQDVDSIPFPDRSLVERIEYGSFYGMKIRENMTGILTTRGCRYGCTYCNRPKKLCFRARSPKNILQELKEIDRMGIKSVWLADDNFTNNPRNVIKLARLIKREKLKFDFYGQARVDAPSESLYKSMEEMGVMGLSYGVESLKPEVIKWYNKTRYPQKWPQYVKKTLDLCDKHGIVFLGSLIFGAPMETKEDMEYSIEFLEKNGADLINGNILLYLVGSTIWYQAVKMGKIKSDQFMASAPEIGMTPYSYEELEELCARCTNFSKREGWKGVIQKVLQRRKFGLIYSGMKEFIRNYWRVRKVRRELYGYGYGKEYTTRV